MGLQHPTEPGVTMFSDDPVDTAAHRRQILIYLGVTTGIVAVLVILLLGM